MAIILKERATALTAIVEPSNGEYVIVCPELDLATEGDSPEAAFDDLIEEEKPGCSCRPVLAE
jgi:hypothetical protein